MATGLTDRGIRMAYNLGRELMWKGNGFIYYFKWEEPDLIPVSFVGIPRTPLKECKSCSKTLTFKDRSRYFRMDLGYGTKDTYI